MTTNDSSANYEVPKGLAAAIRAGRCIAFVGAGFSCAAGLPLWDGLLKSLAEDAHIRADVKGHIKSRLDKQQTNRYEEVAQMLRKEMGQEAFIQAMRQRLCGKTCAAMDSRLNLLRGIPFRAVLTTNFDDLLQGVTPGQEAYRQFLHSPPPLPTSLYANYLLGLKGKSTTIKLHGDLDAPDSIVFSRLDYRKRLYSDPAYLAFLRAVFLNYTILYLGYSFTDAYLNELRSEALAVLGSSDVWPTAYAVVDDMPQLAGDHLRSVEGIKTLPYDTKEGSHAGFDHWLHTLHQATSPVVEFGALLKGKRLLWVDTKPENNEYLSNEFFVEATKQASAAGYKIDKVLNAEEAMEAFKPAPEEVKYDLVITHWGYTRGQASTAQKLLQHIRKEDIRVPVLIYSMRQYADERKPIALGLGAQGYYHSTEGLLKAIERVLKSGAETG